jgi:hypothetical protein
MSHSNTAHDLLAQSAVRSESVKMFTTTFGWLRSRDIPSEQAERYDENVRRYSYRCVARVLGDLVRVRTF